MAYATLSQLRARLPQLPAGPDTDALLTEMLGQASSIVDGALGFSFFAAGGDWSSVAASVRKVRSEPSAWLRLPAYQQGSITLLTVAGDTAAITDYEEDWTSGKYYLWRELGWGSERYAITARYGYGPAPASIVELELELAVNIWRAKDKGLFTEIIGVEGGGAVRYIGGLNRQQQMVIANVRRQEREAVY
jgi:hypothetical protein